MGITGVHTLLFSSQPEELRATLRDIFQWDHVDSGDGWLIFALPPAEMGVHPSDGPAHQISLMCDDLIGTVAELREKGITFRGEPQDQGFGIVIDMVLPGDVILQLYEPRHDTAIEM